MLGVTFNDLEKPVRFASFTLALEFNVPINPEEPTHWILA
jgi:hypothetical protein